MRRFLFIIDFSEASPFLIDKLHKVIKTFYSSPGQINPYQTEADFENLFDACVHQAIVNVTGANIAGHYNDSTWIKDIYYSFLSADFEVTIRNLLQSYKLLPTLQRRDRVKVMITSVELIFSYYQPH